MHNESMDDIDSFIYGAFNNWQDCSTAIQQIISKIPELTINVAYFDAKYQVRIHKTNYETVNYWIIDTINAAASPYLCLFSN